MSEENNVENEEVVEAPVEETTAEKVETPEPPEDDIEAIVEQRLAKMKANMDRMASERDEALKLKADLEAKAKEDTIARMKEEGKLQEALEMELADARAKLASFEEQNTKLSRDNVLNQALAGMEFRNEKSRDMARREIVEQLVQNKKGRGYTLQVQIFVTMLKLMLSPKITHSCSVLSLTRVQVQAIRQERLRQM